MIEFIKKNKELVVQALKYFIASFVALGFDAGGLYILTEWINLYYLIAAVISFTIGLVVIYFISIFWVFPRNCDVNRAKEFLIFCIIGVMGLGVNIAVLWLFTSVFGFYYMISKGFAAIIGFMWNFILRKFILFSKGTR